ncbi:MAG: L,D-transpeptidase [Acidobacteriota bacterium]
MSATAPLPPARVLLSWGERVFALALLAVGVAFGGALVPRAPLPLPAVQRARAALQAARVASAGRTSPELTRAEESARQLESRWAEEAAVRWRPKRSDEIASLAAETEAAAQVASGAMATERMRLVNQLGPRLREAEDRLDAAESAVATDRELRAAAQTARVDLAAANDAAGRGDLAAAESLLASASTALEELDRRLDRREERLSDPAWKRRWQTWVDETIAGTVPDGHAVVVDKARHRGFLVRGGRVVLGFPVELGARGMLRKLWEGDGATPEGRYSITAKKDLGASLYHRALLLDYPNASDRRDHDEAVRRGLVSGRRGPGGLIEIHGDGGRGQDWTNGCVALSDADIDRLFPKVEVGTVVTLVPTAILREAPGSR